MPYSVEQRLLCASWCAYQAAPQAHPRYKAIGYVEAPQVVEGGVKLIDLVTVGATASDVIIAFRGTLNPKGLTEDGADKAAIVRDWMQDLEGGLTYVKNVNGQVHSGFAAALAGLWPEFAASVRAVVSQHPGKPVRLTGHSKGGTLAQIAAVRLVVDGVLEKPPEVCTFAAARAGDRQFAKTFLAHTNNGRRIEFGDDLVPHLAPQDNLRDHLKGLSVLGEAASRLGTGYYPSGALAYYPVKGSPTITGQEPITLFAKRLTSLIAKLVLPPFGDVADHHSIEPGSGYAKAIGLKV